MNYVLMEFVNKNIYDASSKAREDIVAILKRGGAEFVPLYHARSGYLRVFLQIIKSCIVLMKKLRRGDIVFIQYPYPKGVDTFLINYLDVICRIRKCKFCVIVHDINSLRNITESDALDKALYAESRLLKKAHHVIVHNKRMKELLMVHGCCTHYIELELFDYLYEGKHVDFDIIDNKYSIIVAGNLSAKKSGFIYKLNTLNNIHFELYGNGYCENGAENIHWNGSFEPNELIKHLHGAFGLVWDGPSIDRCEGNYGLYLKYNNPHKLSLYIAAGIPVIIWGKAAAAEIVKGMGIGIVISKLSDLEDSIRLITAEDYQTMCNAVRKIGEIVKIGGFMEKAVRKLAENDTK